MAGVEAVGLVLGAFPILLNCLDYYREGFEPLEEWWNFRTNFIAFVDDIRHQMMRYTKNLTILLDPIIADNESLAVLIGDPADPRWRDGSLTDSLERRLSSELERFLRIIDRMHEVMTSLNRLLQIEDGQIAWVNASQQKPWQWHYKRLQISFSKGKHKKVKKLAVHNQELEEILGFSERIIPISDRRKASEPVALLEKIRMNACDVHNALSRRWNCQKHVHRHEAHLSLRAEAGSATLNLILNVSSGGAPASCLLSEGVTFQQKQVHAEIVKPSEIGVPPHSTVFRAAQETMEKQGVLAKGKQSFLHRMSMRFQGMKPASKSTSSSSRKTAKVVQFSSSIPSIHVTPSPGSGSGTAEPAVSLDYDSHSDTSTLATSVTIAGESPEFGIISDFCAFLNDESSSTGTLAHEFDIHWEVRKLTKRRNTTMSDHVKLLSLPQVLDAYHRAAIDISRQHRFEMAAHVASALLQAHLSPWLSLKCSKRDFYFLTDQTTQSLCTSYPFVSKIFTAEAGHGRPSSGYNSRPGSRILSEEDTRTCLFTIGVIILELIFGHNIEDCSFRKDYYGYDDKPNDQTDVSTARRWAKKVLGDSGPNIADAVRRCLDCSFGPKPSFLDVRFREAVYEGVIKPLANYSKVWVDVMP